MKYLHDSRRIMSGLLLPLTLLSLDWWLRGWSGCRCRFWCTINTNVRNCTCLPSNIGLWLSAGDTYLFLFQCQSSPFDCSSSDFPVFDAKVSQREFLIHTSFHHRFIFDNWASISFDESPSLTFLILFWVDQTHISSICTEFPRYHLKVFFLTKTIKLRPILYRIPECCHHGK